MKGFEAIQRKEKEQLSNQNRQLSEKASNLEKDLSQKKEEYQAERMANMDKISTLQAEIQ